MISAVIFDLDGTLVDSNDLHAEAWQETFRHFGKEIAYADLRRQIGKGGDKYLPEFLTAREMREIGPKVEAFRGKLFKRNYLSRVRPFAGVRELFEQLRSDGKRIALASSGVADEVKHYEKLLGIEELVDNRTTKDDVVHSKPASDVFVAALKRLGDVPADKAMAVGDTPYDAQAAKKLGLATIAFRCGGFAEDELRAAGAIALFKDPADLLENYQRSPLAGAITGPHFRQRDEPVQNE
ncbi:MAG: HAD family hydrolase [Chthoniobacterales bacterium]